jgi:hypothetical protein
MLSRALGRLIAWHPFIFMGMAAGLAGLAWHVYPEADSELPPPPEYFYYNGVDHLYRILNPDLPLRTASLGEEALAARNSFLNLFVFHRQSLAGFPEFVNPHLLLAETNRILADANPNLAPGYLNDAAAEYAEAALWEALPRDAAAAAKYAAANFLDYRGRSPPPADFSPGGYLEANADEIELRRGRREEYLKFRIAEFDIAQNRPDSAKRVLGEIQAEIDGRRRDEYRLAVGGGARGGNLPGKIFELGPDQRPGIEFLLARACDGLELRAEAKYWYLRHLSRNPSGREYALATERLAAIHMDEGGVYRLADPTRAGEAYRLAAEYHEALIGSPAATRKQRLDATLGLAVANSRLADLTPADDIAGIDKLVGLGEILRGWLEEFSGHPLPGRTLAIPPAVGSLLSTPEFVPPLPLALIGVSAGGLTALAGKGDSTPLQKRRRFLARAVENYDLAIPGLEEGDVRDGAMVMAARESWRLGRKEETEKRLKRMLDPLSSPELILAARLGLAEVALDRGELENAGLLILGGQAHPSPVWFTADDADWRTLAAKLGNSGNHARPGVWRALWDSISGEGRDAASYAASGRRLDDVHLNRFIMAMNAVLRRPDFPRTDDFPPGEHRRELTALLASPEETLTENEMAWRNRLLIEEALPYDLAARGGQGVVVYPPFPAATELPPDGLVDSGAVKNLLAGLAEKWERPPPAGTPPAEQARHLEKAAAARRAVLDRYRGDPGEINFALAENRERLAALREAQGRRREALSLTAEAGRHYLEVSFEAQNSPREMTSLLSAGDAFYRSGLLERAVESLDRFMDRFGHSSIPGAESTMAVSRAENLLGRIHWLLGDSARAVRSFRRNLSRRTPERFKSIYYIGRVLMDEGAAKDDPEALGDDSEPLPELSRDNLPVIRTALQAFNYLRQSPGINPAARAWRWSSFDLAKLRHLMAERARRAVGEAAPPGNGETAGSGPGEPPWLALHDRAREILTEVLERYTLARNGGKLSVRVEPADYAEVMAARFEAECLLARTLLVLAEARADNSLSALARAHLENLRDGRRYAAALFDPTLDRFQLNAAIIREELGGDEAPLERSRLGDDEGPVYSPEFFRSRLKNSLLLLAGEYFRAGEAALAAGGAGSDDAVGFYRRSYEVYRDIYDRFQEEYGSRAMVGMGDAMSRLGRAEDAANHYRLAKNAARAQPSAEAGGRVDPGPGFWSGVADARLSDLAGGFRTP